MLMDKETSQPTTPAEPTEPRPAPAEAEQHQQPEEQTPQEQQQPEQKAPVQQQQPVPKTAMSPTVLPLALIITGLFLMLAMAFLYLMK